MGIFGPFGPCAWAVKKSLLFCFHRTSSARTKKQANQIGSLTLKDGFRGIGITGRTQVFQRLMRFAGVDG